MLPYTIIEEISKYLLPKAYSFGCIDDDVPFKNSMLTKDFISLMHVCRVWRQSLLPRYYQTVMIQIHRKIPKLKWRINSADDVNSNCRVMVKELLISLDVTTLLLPDNHPKNFKSTLARVPIFPAARFAAINLKSEYYIDSESEKGSLPDESDFNSIMERKIPILAESIHKIAPSSNTVYFTNEITSYEVAAYSTIHEFASPMAYFFSHPELSRLYLPNILAKPLSQTPVVLPQLRSLSLQNIEYEDVAYELIIHNSKTLEYLHIFYSVMTDPNMLIYDSNLPNCTRVYPQLCHLAIHSCIYQFITDIKQPHSNPFPSLKALSCKGGFPFNAPKIFLDGLAKITHLEFSMDKNLYNILRHSHILDKGSFSNLCYLSTDFIHRSQQGSEYESCVKSLIKTTVELSSSARVLKLPQNYILNHNDFLLSLEFPPCLQRLLMPSNPLSLEKLVLLLSKLKHLQEATVGLDCCIDCLEKQMLSDEDIQKYQQRFKSANVGVHTIKVKVYGSRSALKAAEHVILLADILPSVLRMQIYSSQLASGDILSLIRDVTQRAIYNKNKRLQRVKFTKARVVIF